MLACAAVGGPARVQEALAAIARRTRADELIVASAIHEHSARKRSYELLSTLSATLPAPVLLAAQGARPSPVGAA
jgi:alkanesulfonate monooxygenase SsuD/methylene tetrahydromethanopterin reductase-like flavin-dependent oxidoreductase (luciferase family)